MKKDYWTTNFRASHDYYRPPMYGIARSIRAGIDDLALIYVEKRMRRHNIFIYQKCGDRGKNGWNVKKDTSYCIASNPHSDEVQLLIQVCRRDASR